MLRPLPAYPHAGARSHLKDPLAGEHFTTRTRRQAGPGECCFAREAAVDRRAARRLLLRRAQARSRLAVRRGERRPLRASRRGRGYGFEAMADSPGREDLAARGGDFALDHPVWVATLAFVTVVIVGGLIAKLGAPWLASTARLTGSPRATELAVSE